MPEGDRGVVQFGPTAGPQAPGQGAPRGYVFSSSNLPVPYESGEPVSTLEKIAGGTLVGLHRHFLLRPVIDRLGGAFGLDEETMGRMEQRLSGSKLSDVFEFVGEFGPDIAASFGVFGLGRVAAVRALAWAGRTGQGARLLPGAARTAARLGAEGGAGGRMIAKPLIERGAEIAGGSTALSGYVGLERLGQGESLDEAGRAALTTLALTAGLEVGVAATFGRLARSRVVDVEKVEEAFGKTTKFIQSEKEKATTLIGKVNQRIEATNDRVSQQLELARSKLEAARAQPKLPGFEYAATESEKALERGLLKAEEKAAKFYDDLLPKWEQRVLRLESRQAAWDSLLKTDPGGAIYTRGVPYDPKGVRLLYSQLALKILRTPESFKGELGPAWARIFKQLDTAETMSIIARSHNEAVIGKLVDRAQKAMGFSNRQVRKDRAIFLRVFSAWEEGGEAGLRKFMTDSGRRAHADDMVAVFNEIDDAMARVYQPLADMGAEPMLNPRLLQELGVQKYLPHLFDDLPEEEIMKRLASKMGDARAAQLWDAYSREGLGKFSSIDFNRTRAGSLSEKIKGGLPFDPNPFNNLFRYLNTAHRRFEYGSRFGINGELKDPMVTAVVREGGSRELATSLMDTVLGSRYYHQSMRQMSRIVLGPQIASKLTLAVIPNMSQPINALLWGGTRNFVRGFMKAVKGEDRDDVLAAVALSESVIKSTGRMFGEARVGPSLVEGRYAERLANAADKMGYWTLTGTGFSAVERWNRTWSGSTGLFMFRDILGKAVKGRLRGNSLDVARRRMEAMGQNLDDLVRKVRANGDDFLAGAEYKQAEVIATFKAAQQTQFIPAITRRPTLWNHPIGRIFTQFKTFALNQGRFIRDQVFAEAARGNLKPMAYFLSIYPVSGEVVKGLRDVVRGKQRDDDGVARYLRDIQMVGGIGLFSDTWVAAGWGRLLESIVGPTVGDMAQFAERMAQRDVEGVWKMAERQPAWHAVNALTGAGLVTTKLLADYLEELPTFGGEREREIVVDFGTARHREIMKKGTSQ